MDLRCTCFGDSTLRWPPLCLSTGWASDGLARFLNCDFKSLICSTPCVPVRHFSAQKSWSFLVECLARVLTEQQQNFAEECCCGCMLHSAFGLHPKLSSHKAPALHKVSQSAFWHPTPHTAQASNAPLYGLWPLV